MTEQKKEIRIRAAEPFDAAAMSALIGSEYVFEGTLQMPLAAVASRVERYAKTDGNNLNLVAVTETDSGEQVIGVSGLYQTHPSLRRGHTRSLALTVAAPWQGKGIGHKLMAATTHWADNWAHVLRIELTVFADNARAIALYERHGFAREGMLRAFALRDGEYVDALAMARLHPKPPAIR
ncbi:MAG: GNAT family N-acetyltransferase [Burkholderiales bacterium]|nr:MAG: GNAT family N-acetyltransferase [Burkholderiales bacterium]